MHQPAFGTVHETAPRVVRGVDLEILARQILPGRAAAREQAGAVDATPAAGPFAKRQGIARGHRRPRR